MKRILFAIAIVILVAPMYHPVYAQEESIDITGLLNGQGGNQGNRGGNRAPTIPDSQVMFKEIKDTLSKGKAPLDKAQEKPLHSLLDMEIVMLSDKIQLLRNGNGTNNQGFPGNPGQEDPRAGGRGGGRGGRGGGGEGPQAAQQGNTQQQTQQQQQTAQRAAIETLASLKNDEFIDTQLALFLSPEQVALVKKAKADDKNNSSCLGGLFDRVSPNRPNQNQQNRGGNNTNNTNYNNNNNNNSTTKTNGQKYCMAADATAVARLEPIKKVLSNGKLPLTADKEPIAEAFMTANVSKLEDTIRTTLTGNNNQGGRGGNNNNNFNNTKLNQTIRTSTDAIYVKVEAMLNPNQAAVLKTWHYTEMLGRSPIESLIAVNAMQDTPLTDEQVAKVTAAWPELQKQVEKAADAAKTRITEKQRDATAMKKILDMLEPSQVASYELAKKYGPEAAAGNK